MAAHPVTARPEVARLRKSIEDLFERALEIDAGTELAGDMSRYLCVRVSGFLEQFMVLTGRVAAEQHSFGVGQQFALSWLRRSINPSSDAILTFVGRFSPAWRLELEEYLKADLKSDRLNALVGIRNDIAHGRNQGISINQAWEYYELVSEICVWIADRLDPKPGVAPASVP